MRYVVLCHGYHIGRIDVSESGEVSFGTGPGRLMVSRHQTEAIDELRALGADVVPVPDASTWPTAAAPKSLGERCVIWSLERLGIGESRTLWKTGPEIRSWFAPCVRRDTGKALGLTSGNWCAAFASAALQASRMPEEAPPHGYRASGAEIEEDAMQGHCWVPARHLALGQRVARIGDVAVWDRSLPRSQDPQRRTLWHRHVNRVIAVDDDRITTVGGNEAGGRVRISRHLVTDPKLRGVVAYPAADDQAPRGYSELTDEERAHLLAMVTLSLRGLLDEISNSCRTRDDEPDQ